MDSFFGSMRKTTLSAVIIFILSVAFGTGAQAIWGLEYSVLPRIFVFFDVFGLFDLTPIVLRSILFFFVMFIVIALILRWSYISLVRNGGTVGVGVSVAWIVSMLIPVVSGWFFTYSFIIPDEGDPTTCFMAQCLFKTSGYATQSFDAFLSSIAAVLIAILVIFVTARMVTQVSIGNRLIWGIVCFVTVIFCIAELVLGQSGFWATVGYLITGGLLGLFIHRIVLIKKISFLPKVLLGLILSPVVLTIVEFIILFLPGQSHSMNFIL